RRRQPSPAPSCFRSHRSRTSPTDSPNGRPGRAAGGWARRSGDPRDYPPVIHELRGPASREDRTGCLPFVLELPHCLGRLAGLALRVGPLVQPLAIVAAEEIIGVGDVPVE